MDIYGEKRLALRAMRRAVPHLERAALELDEYKCPTLDCTICPLFPKGQPNLDACIALTVRRALGYIGEFRVAHEDPRVI